MEMSPKIHDVLWTIIFRETMDPLPHMRCPWNRAHRMMTALSDRHSGLLVAVFLSIKTVQ